MRLSTHSTRWSSDRQSVGLFDGTWIVNWQYMHDAALIRLRPAAILALTCLFAAPVIAQVTPWQTAITASPDAHPLPADRGADGLAQTLKKLHTWASLMMIV